MQLPLLSPRFSIFLLMATSVLFRPNASGEIVQNSNFTRVEGKETPAEWNLPANSGWVRTFEDGFSGNYSLRYDSSAPAQAAVVTQRVTLPSGKLTLSAALKPGATLRPVVAIRSGDAELARVESREGTPVWASYQTEFDSTAGGEALVEICLVSENSQDGLLPAGGAGVDAVEILREGESPMRGTAGTEAAPRHTNLALGKRYTYSPNPSYPHCTDEGDTLQLTDGVYTTGYFWTQKTTVGWLRTPLVEITLDLGEHFPIRGLSFNTAAGTAGAKWPKSIRVLVSADGRKYHEIGDLVELGSRGSAPPKDYAVHRFETDELETHGRYVKLLVEPDGTTLFADEIEVYEGEEGWKVRPLPGPGVVYGEAYFEDPFNSALKNRLGADLQAVTDQIEAAKLDGTAKSGFLARARALGDEVRNAPSANPEGFVGIYPFSPLHAQIYALLGAAREASEMVPLAAWRANPWDPLKPADPPTAAAEVFVAAMKGETRAAALNLTNNTGRDQTVHLSLEGLGGDTAFVTVREVLWTDTSERTTVGAALPEAVAKDGIYTLRIPAGMTRQVWFSVTPPRTMKAGEHAGAVVVSPEGGEDLRIPFRMRVFDVEFPERPRLSLSGWDYTDVNIYGNTPQNRAPLAKFLRERGVDSPWATKGTLGFGKFDEQGRMVTDPDTAGFDAWVALWPDARRYHVFTWAQDRLAGTPVNDPLFGKMVGAWIRFWVNHAQKLGIPPEKLGLCLVDESKNAEEDRLLIEWAKAIRAEEPRLLIFDTGTRPVERNTPEVLAIVDILCPHRPTIFGGRASPDIYRQQRKAGKQLFLYSCTVSGRMADPYSYYRLQAWDCFDLGAEGSAFWSFSDTSGADPWNEYVPTGAVWTPLFLDKDRVTSAKQMEAIAESAADYEYLSLLRDAVEWTRKFQPSHPALPEAERLLREAVPRVTNAEGARSLKWEESKDRSIADTVRLEIGTMLERLKPGP